jgi:GNAT superfamily N-acetyltransferase
MPIASIHIRTATAADAPLLAQLGSQTFYDSFAADNTPENMAAYLAESFSPQKQAAELAEAGSLFLIAEHQGQVLGYTRLRQGAPPQGVTGARPLEIVRLYAVQSWIGQGVGAALMQAALDEARRRGCDTVWLDVWEPNQRARDFYARWGFIQVGIQTFKLGEELQQDLVLQRVVS